MKPEKQTQKQFLTCYSLFLAIVVCILSGCTFTNLFLHDEGNEGDRTTLPVSLEALIEMGEYSKLIYTDNKIFSEGQVSPDEPEFYGLNMMIGKQSQLKRNEFSYYVIEDSLQSYYYKKGGPNKNRFRGIAYDNVMAPTILIFRGTANTKNVWTDADMRMWHDEELDLYLHRGFRDAADIIYKDIKNKYELEPTVYLTGHSLGGAIAQIIGIWLHKEGYNVQIYTFGSPKVTTTFLFNEPNHWRVAVRSDPVPYMPSLPYVHSGIHIDPETLEWDETHQEDSMWGIDSLDHSVVDYLDILYNHSECNAECRGSRDIRD